MADKLNPSCCICGKTNLIDGNYCELCKRVDKATKNPVGFQEQRGKWVEDQLRKEIESKIKTELSIQEAPEIPATFKVEEDFIPPVKGKKTSSKIRCYKCTKKIGWVAIKCRCEDYFCAQHRLDHNCNYDYRGVCHAKMAQESTKVKRKQIQDI